MLNLVYKDELRRKAAEIAVSAARELLGDKVNGAEGLFLLDLNLVYKRLEKPKNPEMGNYALPLFELAKTLKINPVEFNLRLSVSQNSISEKSYGGEFVFSATSGFNNCRVKTARLAEESVGKILKLGSEYGSSDEGAKKKIVIDYSSPNIAKPFGIGHLRTTAIGHSLYRIFKKLGYKPVGINHLGDWGTQFGKLIVAYRKWGDEHKLKQDPIKYLYELYVRFHKEEETTPALTDEARGAFKELEEGGKEAQELWSKFRADSIEAFKLTYERLGIVFDLYWGEAHYNPEIPKAIERLEKAGLLEESQGALTVNLEKYNLPPCLIRKSDGATLYGTRDVAAVLYRYDKLNFEKALYVVGSAQRDHFQQVFRVIEMLDTAEGRIGDEAIHPRLEHIEFGWIKLNDQMMSTRLGTMIMLKDVLDRAAELAKEKIIEKNPDLKEIDKTAEMIGIGAVLFADLVTRRQRDVNFDWQEVLSFEGETGPYLQYTHARLSSLLRKYGKKIPSEIDYNVLDNPEEAYVIDLLYRFPEVIVDAAKVYEPSIICSYLLELGSAFNKVYQRKDSEGRIDKIISDDEKQSAARMALVEGVRVVIKEGLYLLGIDAPEEM